MSTHTHSKNNYLCLNYIQPCIVKFQDLDILPDNVRNKYFIQLNMPNLAVKGSIPAIYIQINRKMFSKSNDNSLGKFMNNYLNNHSLIYTGTDYFINMTDYYINETLWSCKTNILKGYIKCPCCDGSSSGGSTNYTPYKVKESTADDGTTVYYVYNTETNETVAGPYDDKTVANDSIVELVNEMVAYDPWLILDEDPEDTTPLSESIRWDDDYESTSGTALGMQLFGIDDETETEEETEDDDEKSIEETGRDSSGKYVSFLPDYIESGAYNDDIFECVMEGYANLNNLDLYFKHNLLLTYDFTEEELDNFYLTFCKVILANSDIFDISTANEETSLLDNPITSLTDTINSDYNTTTNLIYQQVLKYYSNGSYDSISTSLSLVLSTLYTTESTTSTTCGCNSGTSGSTAICTPCSTLYSNAMSTYLTTMLGDINFYNDWFTYIDNEGTTYGPNISLCDKLIELLNEFIDLDYVLSFGSYANKNCTCQALSNDDSECNYKILNNYIKVLEWIRDGEAKTNKNKIKIYGKQFAELLVNLQF